MWKVSAFDIQEATRKRPRFSDLVRFINRQAKIAAGPVFGDIKDIEDKGKHFSSMRTERANRPKGSTFATSVAPAINENLKMVKAPLTKSSMPFRSHVHSVRNNTHWQNVSKSETSPIREDLSFLKEKDCVFHV